MGASGRSGGEPIWLVLAVGGLALGVLLSVASYFFLYGPLVIAAVALAVVSTIAAAVLGFFDARATGSTMRSSIWAATKTAFSWLVLFP